MKTFFLLLSFGLISTAAFAQDVSGVLFFKGSWQEALAEAKRQQKPLFVDVYTTWCGPCKQMDKEAFPNPELAARYNAAFVNYKLDAEKGEGPAIAKQYAVTSYPNLLYLTADGSLIHRSTGYLGVQAMLADVDKTFQMAATFFPLNELDREYTNSKGKNTPQFLRIYLSRRAQVRMPNNEALTEYLTMLPDDSLRMPATVQLIASNLTDVRSTAYASLLDHLTKLLQSTQSNDKTLAHEIDSRMRRSIDALVRQATQEKDEALLEQAIAAETKLTTIVGRQFISNARSVERQTNDRRLFFLHTTKQTERFRELALTTANRLMAISDDSLRRRDEAGALRNSTLIQRLSTASEIKPQTKRIIFAHQHEGSAEVSERLWSVSSLFYRHFTEQSDLHHTMEWSTRALSLNRTSSNLMNHSSYLYKMGRIDESTELLREAIVVTKEEGRDVQVLEEILANRPAKK